MNTDLFGNPVPEEVHLPGDELGRSYTPLPCALAVMRRIESLTGAGRAVQSFLEPCLGGGAFVVAARAVYGSELRVVGWDVDPKAPGRDLVSRFETRDSTVPRALYGAYFDLAVTNPPFGEAVGQGVTVGIVRAMRTEARIAAVILPVDVICQAGFEDLVREAVHVAPLLPRPWKHERGMVLLVWMQGCTPAAGLASFEPLRWRA